MKSSEIYLPQKSTPSEKASDTKSNATPMTQEPSQNNLCYVDAEKTCPDQKDVTDQKTSPLVNLVDNMSVSKQTHRRLSINVSSFISTAELIILLFLYLIKKSPQFKLSQDSSSKSKSNEKAIPKRKISISITSQRSQFNFYSAKSSY